MKWTKISVIAAVGLLMLGLSACSYEKVPAGSVGVKVYLLGGEKGVDTEELGVGRYLIGINEDLFLFPTFTQNYVWTKDNVPGSREDESFTFQTVEGLSVGADVGISYHINPEKVSAVFQKYRRGVDEITDTFLRNMVRDAFVQVASTRPVESVYGAGKTEIIEEVQSLVRQQVSEIGIEVEKIYYIGELRLPPTVITALNAKIEATQKAQQRENEVAQAQAEADIKREQAAGDGDARIIAAKAEAEALRIQGKAIAENPQVLTLNAIERWDGVLPRVSSGEVVPFLNIDSISKSK